ncbi:hypothetical protein SAMN06295926_12485 [Lysinibacillus sp. AC-3]|nr:hypothetical protein SAMN06295926_12485 [Lysinibacillus sp. AC-3]
MCAALPRVFHPEARVFSVLPRVFHPEARVFSVLPRVFHPEARVFSSLPQVFAWAREFITFPKDILYEKRLPSIYPVCKTIMLLIKI